jgi:hypothetical protein
VDDVIVTLERAPSMVGYASFQGTSPRPSAGELARVRVTLHAATRRALRSRRRLDRNGEFSLPALLPGQYFVHVTNPPPGWSARAVAINGREASDSPVALAEDRTRSRFHSPIAPRRFSGSCATRAGSPRPAQRSSSCRPRPAMPRSSDSNAPSPRLDRGVYNVVGLPPATI